MLDLFKRKSADEEKKPWSERLADGLARSREKLAGALTGAFSRRKLDEGTLEEIETALLTADVGVAATQQVLDDLRVRWKRAGADDEPEAAPQGGASRPHRAAREAARHHARPPVRHHAGRGERRRQDDLDRQARATLSESGPLGAACRRRHVSGPPRASNSRSGALATA
jgi:hypothetical protein